MERTRPLIVEREYQRRIRIEADRAHRICASLETTVVQFQKLYTEMQLLLDTFGSLFELLNERAKPPTLPAATFEPGIADAFRDAEASMVALQKARRAIRRARKKRTAPSS